MNRFTLALKRPFIWLSRFRHRCGYGVHSPFAFNLITSVIYERTPYYKYSELVGQEKLSVHEKGKKWAYAEPLKLKRLLFRLANYAQPRIIIDVGEAPTAAALYLKAGCEKADYLFAGELSELFLESDAPVGLLYLHDCRRTELLEKVFHLCADRVTEHSIFLVQGIGYNPQMRTLWKRMQQDVRTGISFDLYDVGILFFDKSKNKQSYIVNF